ncbi:MAG: ABC transporter substrate-binding protein [Anaerolineae bacterium]|nr:ABC transporter substrate-binding protein [Anaerolineae bacterium]MDW8298657.1 ABC transporter substrate-binding protein [Anaerolineae bacterium]
MRKLLSILFVLSLALSACIVTGDPQVGIMKKDHGEVKKEGAPKVEPTAEATAEPTAEPTVEPTPGAVLPYRDVLASETDLVPITLFLGYIPNVQFAPVYVAIEQGFFAEEGIALKIEHGFDETEGLTRIATDNLQFGMISGEQVVLARAQGAPVKYFFRWYQRFPVGVVVPKDSPIRKPQDLKGKIVGVPGKFGASYFGLKALLNAAGMSEADLREVRAIGYDTAPIFCERQVDASVIYIANEPLQIAARCFDVEVIAISDYADLVSNGLVTNEKTIAERPELVRGMARAYGRGLALTIADPDLAYQISRKYVEGLAEDDPVQKQVLLRSIELWKAERLGESTDSAWKLTAETLLSMGLIDSIEGYQDAFTNEFLPESYE